MASLLRASLIVLVVFSVGCNCGGPGPSDGGSGGGTGTGAGGAGGAGGGGGVGGGGGGGVGGGAGGGGGGGGGDDAGLDAGSDAGTDGGSDAGCPGTAPTCLGVCATTPPLCVSPSWTCTGPGHQATETRCDGFDNDCDGTTDEGCPVCAVDLARAQQNLFSKWDIDFDAQCNSYLTTLVSGPDHLTLVPADAGEPVETWVGNANQNMGFALVDPDPDNRRVVVAYSCCEACNCQAKNGLTLLYTCDGGTPGCGCAGQTNCPGFLDAPFLPSVVQNTSVQVGAVAVASPTGLAAGPGNTYFVGNWRPETCSLDAGTCTACDPANPTLWCSPAKAACCDTTAMGRLAQFTLPGGITEPQFRVVAVWPGEEILTVASTAGAEVMVGTRTASGGGALYRYTPATRTSALVASFATPVYSVAPDRRNGELYLELLSGSPKLHRLSAAGATLALPSALPASPANTGRLQFGPDDKLYRLVGVANATSTLTVFTVP